MALQQKWIEATKYVPCAGMMIVKIRYDLESRDNKIIKTSVLLVSALLLCLVINYPNLCPVFNPPVGLGH